MTHARITTPTQMFPEELSHLERGKTPRTHIMTGCGERGKEERG